MNKRISLIISLLFIIFITGCQYIIQFPETEVEKVEREVDSSIGIYDDLKEKSKTENGIQDNC